MWPARRLAISHSGFKMQQNALEPVAGGTAETAIAGVNA